MANRCWRRFVAFAFHLLYNPFAWAYDGVSWAVSGGEWQRWQRAVLPYLKGRRVLEIGFGTGNLLVDMAAWGFQSWGVDLSPTMACDRTNERVSYLYEPLHPAILRLIKRVIDAAHGAGKWVGMCGEMAREPLAIPILLGLGLDEFSMNATAIPEAKAVIRSLGLAEAEEIAAESLSLPSAEEVRAYLKGRLSI